MLMFHVSDCSLDVGLISKINNDCDKYKISGKRQSFSELKNHFQQCPRFINAQQALVFKLQGHCCR